MIVEDRLRVFINSLDRGNPEYLNEIEKYAKATDVPIIRKEMQSLLRTLLALCRPQRILEVGTAIGFSALLMSEYAPQECHITTIEKYEKRIPLAKENFKKAGKEDAITLLEGDAVDILKNLKEPFDFIFMDPPYGKGLEREALEYLAGSELLAEEGVIIVEATRETEFDYLDSLGFTAIKTKIYKTNKHVFIEPKGRKTVC